jgi:3-polyprenyl-4-hydroxybenzoate decarboxylase
LRSNSRSQKALRKSAAIGGPAFLFKNNGTDFPLVGGVYNTRAKALIALESTEATVVERILRGLSKRIPPEVVKDAPVHENIITGNGIDLSALPVPKYSPDDGGPYITPGIVVSKDPKTGVPDIGHYRFEIIDRQTMSFNALGSDPSPRWDVEVPARAEVVIEFEADFTKEVSEGPLGEYTGYYTPASPKPIARVKAITHRSGAYFQGLLTGVPPTENHILKQLPFEASFLAMMRKQFPTIERVAIPPSGGVSFYIVMSMKPRYAGEARSALLAAISTNLRPKTVIVVDPDIDVHSSDQVEWATAFRMQPERDVIIVDSVPAGPLDPSVDDSIALDARTGSAIGIDATYPFGAEIKSATEVPAAGHLCGPAVAEHGHEFFEVAAVPGWQEYDFPELRNRGSKSPRVQDESA